MDFQQHLKMLLEEKHWPYSLKKEQETALNSVYQGQHTLCVYPTGFGKSDIITLAGSLLAKVQFCLLLINSHVLFLLNILPLNLLCPCTITIPIGV